MSSKQKEKLSFSSFERKLHTYMNLESVLIAAATYC